MSNSLSAPKNWPCLLAEAQRLGVLLADSDLIRVKNFYWRPAKPLLDGPKHQPRPVRFPTLDNFLTYILSKTLVHWK